MVILRNILILILFYPVVSIYTKCFNILNPCIQSTVSIVFRMFFTLKNKNFHSKKQWPLSRRPNAFPVRYVCNFCTLLE
jgi:hypothetical protein